MRRRIEKDRITRLELNQSWGWVGENLDFLWEVPGLTRLHLLDSRIEDIAGVYHLSDLEDLTLDARSFKTEIDLTRFAKLHRLVLDWRERVINLSACRKLKSLGLWSYQFPDCRELSGLTNLERLTLSESPVRSLAGLEGLPLLRTLRLLTLRVLHDLSAVASIPRLDYLEARGCRQIKSLDPIAASPTITELNLEIGDIPTLKPLINMKQLRRFVMLENKVEDGDMSVFLKMPQLEWIGFDNRRHYSHTLKQIHEQTGIGPIV